MSPEDLTIPITCSNGAKYLLKIGEMLNLPENIKAHVCDVALIKVEGEETIRCLFEVGARVLQYLKIYPDVVLYFMYDDKEIKRGKNHLHLSPQEYRSKLFNAFFNRFREELSYKNIRIDEQESGNCFCWTIASLHSNSEAIDMISNEIHSYASK